MMATPGLHGGFPGDGRSDATIHAGRPGDRGGPGALQLRRARSRPYLHKNPRVIGVSNTTRRDLANVAKSKKKY